MWRKVGIGVLVTNILVLNGIIGFLVYEYLSQNNKFQANSNILNTNGQNNIDICGEECQRVVAEKIDALRIEFVAAAGPSAQPKVSLTPTQKPAAKTGTVSKPKTQTITYVTIPGSGSSQNMNWENLAGTEFYFNPTDYPGLVTVYFEANIKLFNGNGMAYFQLFDSTHGIGVQGSNVQTTSQANTITVSGRVSFWAGNNLIKVQAKTLTADTAVFNSGRLKIIQEN